MTGYLGRITAVIIYNGKDITKDISQYIKKITYTDAMSGEADSLAITLEDTEKLWQNAWIPEKGDTLDVTLQSEYWDGEQEPVKIFPLGLFEIDEIECQGPPTEATIKAVSVPDNTTLRGVDRSRSWEKAELKTIVKDIADEARLTLFYDSKDNPKIDRVEQTEQSDLSFLQALCEDNGLALKITDKKIVVFNEETYEQAETSFMIVPYGIEVNTDKPAKRDISGYRFTTAIRNVYKACRVSYQNGETNEKIEYLYTDPKKIAGKTMQVNKQVDSIGEAEKLAKKELRNKNKDEIKGALFMRGSFDYAAGLTVDVDGFGYFNGKYIITRAEHSIGDGYECHIEIRRCLDGY